MRTAFIDELSQQARQRENLFLVVGDLGFSVVEGFAREFPGRFLNCGVAEQNMTGVAAGLASEGYHVFTYSIGNFATLRCLEQIRNDVAYHGLAVTVVSVGAGVAYGNLGYSHHAVQDVGILRTLSNLAILSPADPDETRESLRWLVNHAGPSYLRLGKAGEPSLHSVKGFEHGPLELLRGDGDVAIAGTGAVVRLALEAAKVLLARGRQVPVFSCPLLQPVASSYFEVFRQFKRLVVLEEHVPWGGLAALLRERLPSSTAITVLAITADVLGKVGSREYLWQLAGLSRDHVVAAVLEGGE